ncbi:MAG: flagellar biosynthetic protein FliO [Ilumatobacteraceae bacterium]
MEFEIVHSVVATSVTMLTLRLMGSVLLLSVAAWAITVGMRNRRPGSKLRQNRNHLVAVGRLSLTRRSSVVLVKSGDRTFLLGSSDSNLVVIAEGDDLVLPTPDGPEPQSFQNAFADALRQRFGGNES